VIKIILLIPLEVLAFSRFIKHVPSTLFQELVFPSRSGMTGISSTSAFKTQTLINIITIIKVQKLAINNN
jgi:hypothetical protein